jgi:hypothetical protein
MKNQKIVWNEYTQTFRAQPSNVWLASVKDGKLIFDSWDGLAKEWLTQENKIKVIRAHVRRKIGLRIQDILNNYKLEFGAVTMNNPRIISAAKYGFVRIISATQQEFTEKGYKYFFNPEIPLK